MEKESVEAMDGKGQHGKEVTERELAQAPSKVTTTTKATTSPRPHLLSTSTSTHEQTAPMTVHSKARPRSSPLASPPPTVPVAASNSNAQAKVMAPKTGNKKATPKTSHGSAVPGDLPAPTHPKWSAKLGNPRAASFYAILGVKPDVADVELRRAYYRMCLRYHPDRSGSHGKRKSASKQESAALFQRINHAYNVLKDPIKRHLYDANPSKYAYGPSSSGPSPPQPSSTPSGPLALKTGDQNFLAMELALAFQDYLPLLDIIPAIERKFGLAYGEVSIQLPGTDEEKCAGDSSCTIVTLTHPQPQNHALPLALCTAHKRLHQHSPDCHTRDHVCNLLARGFQHQWLREVAANWIKQESADNDPIKPNYPYWFNVRTGMSEWCEHEDGGDTEPPAHFSTPHECTESECAAAGFQELFPHIWICRKSCTLHICTTSQCRFRCNATRHSSGATDTEHNNSLDHHQQKQGHDQDQDQDQEEQKEALDIPAARTSSSTASKSNVVAMPKPVRDHHHTDASQEVLKEYTRCWASKTVFEHDGSDALFKIDRLTAFQGGTDSELRVIEYLDQKTGKTVKKVVERPRGSNVGRRLLSDGSIAPRHTSSDASLTLILGSPASASSSGQQRPKYGDISPVLSNGSESPLYQSGMDYIARLERRRARQQRAEIESTRERLRRESIERGDQGWDSPSFASPSPRHRDADPGSSLASAVPLRDEAHGADNDVPSSKHRMAKDSATSTEADEYLDLDADMREEKDAVNDDGSKSTQRHGHRHNRAQSSQARSHSSSAPSVGGKPPQTPLTPGEGQPAGDDKNTPSKSSSQATEGRYAYDAQLEDTLPSSRTQGAREPNNLVTEARQRARAKFSHRRSQQPSRHGRAVRYPKDDIPEPDTTYGLYVAPAFDPYLIEESGDYATILTTRGDYEAVEDEEHEEQFQIEAQEHELQMLGDIEAYEERALKSREYYAHLHDKYGSKEPLEVSSKNRAQELPGHVSSEMEHAVEEHGRLAAEQALHTPAGEGQHRSRRYRKRNAREGPSLSPRALPKSEPTLADDIGEQVARADGDGNPRKKPHLS